MIKRIGLLTLVGIIGIVIGSYLSGLPQTLQNALRSVPLPPVVANVLQSAVQAKASTATPGAVDSHGAEKEGPEGAIEMTAEGIAAAKIELASVGNGVLARRLTVPGVVAPDADRIARVAAKVVGTVSELNKRLGDSVKKGDVVAVLDSREVADAKSELLSALVNQDLQSTLFEREQSLWDKKISAEQQYLRARTSFSEIQLRADLARQKLTALGLSSREVAEVGKPGASFRPGATGLDVASPSKGLQRYELQAPISGRIVERRVDLGAPVGGEGQEKEIYVIADLSSVWVELSIPTSELALVREGQDVEIFAGSNGGPSAKARIVFISPMLNAETRSARVIASMGNEDFTWRPGTYVTAKVAVEEHAVDLILSRSALQTLNGNQVVFVRTATGFEKREVVLGKSDDASYEVVFGLDPGEQVAVVNSFVLKAELGKAEAEHAH